MTPSSPIQIVKGGVNLRVNLRAWFGSLRYSEDLDLDVHRGESFELRDKMQALLRAPAFQSLLRAQRVAVTRTTTPKQTETTQRWKFQLTATGRATPCTPRSCSAAAAPTRTTR